MCNPKHVSDHKRAISQLYYRDETMDEHIFISVIVLTFWTKEHVNNLIDCQNFDQFLILLKTIDFVVMCF